jgi:glycoside/pentoside/hexuronide:cation symporter, GPH family
LCAFFAQLQTLARLSTPTGRLARSNCILARAKLVITPRQSLNLRHVVAMTPERTAQSPSMLVLLAYALPAIPIAALGQPFYMFAPTFYAKEVGLSAGIIAVILVVVRLLDGVADLVCGRLSDRTPGRFGRRRPWVLLASPLASVSAYMVLTPPPDADALYFGVWTLIASIAWAAIVLPLNAWGAELSTTYQGRAIVTAWREVATILGVIGAVAVVVALTRNGLQRDALAALGLFAAVSTPLACGLCVLLVPDRATPKPDQSSLMAGLRACRSNAPFRRLILAYVINGIANGLPATLFLYFVSERLGRADLQGPLLGLYFLVGLMSAPVWAVIGGRVGKHVAWCWAMIWACLVFALALLVNGPEDIWLFALICAGSGAALGADVVLPAAMQADVVDLDELETGKPPRTGLYFALWSVATKLALALAAGLAFGGLELADFNTAGGAQTPLGLTTLSLLYCAFPIALKIWSISLMWRFEIGKAEQARIRMQIEGRVAQA